MHLNMLLNLICGEFTVMSLNSVIFFIMSGPWVPVAVTLCIFFTKSTYNANKFIIFGGF